ncbi:MAG: GspH/FimT family pseudopilin [Bacillota bacterium]
MTQSLLKRPDPRGLSARAQRGRCGVKRPAGFTLVEVVLVVTIIGIVAGIAVPRYANALHTYRAAAAAQRIAADLALVQAHAKATSSTKTITFNVGSNSYDLPSDPGLARLQGGYTVRLGGAPYRVKLESADFNHSASVSFNGFGIPNSGGSVVISVGNKVRTVTVDASTGTAVFQ